MKIFLLIWHWKEDSEGKQAKLAEGHYNANSSQKTFILDNFIIMNFIFHVTIPLFTQLNTFSINKYDF